MKTMARRITLIICAFVFINVMKAQQENPENLTAITGTIVPDTIVRTDTIVVKEVITRTDVIHRTETVVRYEESHTGSSHERYSPASGNVNSVLPSPQTSTNIIVPETSEVTSGEYSRKPLNPSEFQEAPDNVGEGSWELLPPVVKVEVPEKDQFDPDEKVTFRGDTIPMVLRDRNLGRYDRGLYNFLFIPKGIWQLGLTASYGEFSTSDLEILDLVSDIDFSGHLFSIRPYVSYFFRSNLSLGLRLGYTSGKAAVGSFNLDVDEDINFNLHDIMYRSRNYSAAITFSQYLGIARKGRFGVFNEVELSMAAGSSDFHRPYNGDLRKTHTNTFKAALNFSPGVCVYVLDKVSFNVSLGVFGLYIQNEKQKVNGEDLGHRTTSGANFRFNIFNINFGIAVNI